MNMRWLRAKWVLGTALVWHVLRMCWVRDRRFGVWLGRLKSEGLHDGHVRLNRPCVGCGCCAYGFAGSNPMSMLMGNARMPDGLQEMEGGNVQALNAHLQKVCPVGVQVSGYPYR